MSIMYKSTRGGEENLTASQAILKGLADDGGLFVPQSIPHLDKSLYELSNLTYVELAYEVMKLYLTDFTEDELKHCINSAYTFTGGSAVNGGKFDDELIAPIREADGYYYLELFHGETLAFKDMALSILPYFMTVSADKNNIDKDIVILAATSGDTGKAALAGFADVDRTKIIVFYPKDGVSPIQEKQMITQKGDNTRVIGIRGNFDDAQSGVKAILSDKDFKAESESNGFLFSSANSINIGRLVPQIAYYVYAYASLLRDGKITDGEVIDVAVPTGNFGNILAAFYAKQMGIPLGKLICASNDNKVLYDFFESGTYDREREFFITTSPSMDILVSSNLERFIYHICGNDPVKTKSLMSSLVSDKHYSITPDMKKNTADFYGNYSDMKDTAAKIKSVYEQSGYILDTHTAVAAAVADKFKSAGVSEHKILVVSTASPYKFTRYVLGAIDSKYKDWSEFELVDELSRLSLVSVPNAIDELRSAKVLHDHVVDIEDIQAAVKAFLTI